MSGELGGVEGLQDHGSESLHRAGASAKQWFGRKATQALSLPLSFFGKTIEATSMLLSSNLIAPLAGAGHAAAWTIDQILQVPGYLLQIGAVHSAIGTLEPMTREVLDQSVQNAVSKRESLGNKIEWGLKAVKTITSMTVPFVGVVTGVISAGAEYGASLEKMERAAERENLGIAGRGCSIVASAVNKLAPAGFWSLNKVLQVPRIGTSFLSDKTYALWTNPQAPRMFIQNVGDRINSYSSRMWHCFEEARTPEAQKKAAKIDLEHEVALVGQGDIEQFDKNLKQEDAE